MKEALLNLFKKTPLYVYLNYLIFRYRRKNLEDKEKQKIFFSQFLKEGDLCFDVGANIGNKSEIFLSLGAKVVAVEPQSFCYKFLMIRFKNKIAIKKAALGAREHSATIHLSNSNTISSLSLDWINKVKVRRFKNYSWDKSEKVKVITLDDLIAEFGEPKFCKIDVEGFEAEVLKGLTTKIKFISIEFAWPESLHISKKCLEHLQQLGEYECNYSDSETMQLKFTEWVSGKTFLSKLNELNAFESDWGDIYIRFI